MKTYQQVMIGSAFGCAVGAYVTYGLLSQESVHSDNKHLEDYLKRGSEAGETAEEEKVEEKEQHGVLDLRRKAYIVRGGCFDLCGHVVVHANSDFDLDKTIFGNLESQVARRFVRDRVGITPFWTETSQQLITKMFSRIPKAPQHDKALLEFMEKKCDFSSEHADGSFWDHLRFCYEYSAVHYREKSPRVLLLHSIMGVGTNMFPMSKDKIPELRSLVTEFEFEQIEFFPTALRLIAAGPMIDELLAIARSNPSKLKSLKSVVCYRVIDNERIEVDAEAFWVQMNYQAMHLLDFLPLASWKANQEDGFLRNFTLLHELLTKADKMLCKIDFDVKEAESSRGGQHKTLATEVFKMIPPERIWKMARQNIKKFSANINHSLDYELRYS